jgi:transposase
VISESDKLWLKLFSDLNEVQRRRFAALKAIELKRGGVSQVCKLTGMSHHTVKKGMEEIKSKSTDNSGRLRKKGGGRKSIMDKDPKIKEEIERILEESTAGDPMSPLKWTNKSTYTIAAELRAKGKPISEDTICRILKQQEYTLQANKKTNESCSAEERDSQFIYINKKVKAFIERKLPVISVDTKKKELVGAFKNAGRTWRKKNTPEKVSVYDFPALSKGKAIPYGTYDIANNEGFVSVGISNETAEFSVESIRQWWRQLGKKHYASAGELLITADCGGGNGSRSKGWKYYLQKLSNETGLRITVLHFPPGTSKWNKIEHRLFSFISMNWKGKPLISYEVIINLMKGTKTVTGLKVYARLDKRTYAKGKKFSEEEIASVNIRRHSHNPPWNYTISPAHK